MMKNYNYDYIVIIHHDEECEEQDQHCWHDQFHVLEYQNSVGESYFCPCNKVPHANLIGWSDVEMRSEKFKGFSGDSSKKDSLGTLPICSYKLETSKAAQFLQLD